MRTSTEASEQDEEQRFRSWLQKAEQEGLEFQPDFVGYLYTDTTGAPHPADPKEFPRLSEGREWVIAYRAGKKNVASGAIYLVPCEECGRAVVRNYDRVCAEKRWAAGHFCRASDGVAVPCRKDPKRNAPVKLAADLEDVVKKNGRTTVEKNALAVLLSQLRKKDTIAIRFEHFWVMLGERLIRSSKGYAPLTCEHMIAAALRWVRETKR